MNTTNVANEKVCEILEEIIERLDRIDSKLDDIIEGGGAND